MRDGKASVFIAMGGNFVAATKTLIHRASTSLIEQQLDAERDGIIDCMHTDEFRTAIDKFMKKGK